MDDARLDVPLRQRVEEYPEDVRPRDLGARRRVEVEVERGHIGELRLVRVDALHVDRRGAPRHGRVRRGEVIAVAAILLPKARHASHPTLVHRLRRGEVRVVRHAVAHQLGHAARRRRAVSRHDLEAVVRVEARDVGRIRINQEAQLVGRSGRDPLVHLAGPRVPHLQDLVRVLVVVVHGPDPHRPGVGERGVEHVPRVVVHDEVHVHDEHVHRVLLEPVAGPKPQVELLDGGARQLAGVGVPRVGDVLVVEATVGHRKAIRVLGPHLQEHPPAEHLAGGVPAQEVLGRRRFHLLELPIQRIDHLEPLILVEARHDRNVKVHRPLGVLVLLEVAGLEVDDRRGAGPGRAELGRHDGRQPETCFHQQGVVDPHLAHLPDEGLSSKISCPTNRRPTDAVAAALGRRVAVPDADVVELCLRYPGPSHGHSVADFGELGLQERHWDADLVTRRGHVVAPEGDFVDRVDHARLHCCKLLVPRVRRPARHRHRRPEQSDLVTILEAVRRVEHDLRALRVPAEPGGVDVGIIRPLRQDRPRQGGPMASVGLGILQASPGVDGSTKRQVVIRAQQPQHVRPAEAPAFHIEGEGRLGVPPPSLPRDRTGDQLAADGEPVGLLVAVRVAIAHRIPPRLRDRDARVAIRGISRVQGRRALGAVPLAPPPEVQPDADGVGVVRVARHQPVAADDIRLLLRQALPLHRARPVGPATLVSQDLHLPFFARVRGGLVGPRASGASCVTASDLHPEWHVHDGIGVDFITQLQRQVGPGQIVVRGFFLKYEAHPLHRESARLEPIDRVVTIQVAIADVVLLVHHDGIVVTCVDLHLLERGSLPLLNARNARLAIVGLERHVETLRHVAAVLGPQMASIGFRAAGDRRRLLSAPAARFGFPIQVIVLRLRVDDLVSRNSDLLVAAAIVVVCSLDAVHRAAAHVQGEAERRVHRDVPKCSVPRVHRFDVHHDDAAERLWVVELDAARPLPVEGVRVDTRAIAELPCAHGRRESAVPAVLPGGPELAEVVNLVALVVVHGLVRVATHLSELVRGAVGIWSSTLRSRVDDPHAPSRVRRVWQAERHHVVGQRGPPLAALDLAHALATPRVGHASALRAPLVQLLHRIDRAPDPLLRLVLRQGSLHEDAGAIIVAQQVPGLELILPVAQAVSACPCELDARERVQLRLGVAVP
mmetsp:Transcript_62340/g.190524  ORF Transcript_62340/g.190524 Transcript_62340/m.190524 type:complete len:1171 (+) Transcript_62340:1898-5410(+)